MSNGKSFTYSICAWRLLGPSDMAGKVDSSTDPNVGKTLASLKSGKMQMGKEDQKDFSAGWKT